MIHIDIAAIHQRTEQAYDHLRHQPNAHLGNAARQHFNYDIPALLNCVTDLLAANETLTRAADATRNEVAAELARLRQIEQVALAWHAADQRYGDLLFSDGGHPFLAASEALTTATEVLAETIASTRKA